MCVRSRTSWGQLYFPSVRSSVFAFFAFFVNFEFKFRGFCVSMGGSERLRGVVEDGGSGGWCDHGCDHGCDHRGDHGCDCGGMHGMGIGAYQYVCK